MKNKTVAGSNLNLNCKSELTEKFTLINENVEIPQLDFFHSHIEGASA